MSQTERYQRVRLLVKRLNRERKRQARKIDILCNDLIGAQRSFLHRLQDISFAAEFYRALLSGTDVNRVLAQASRVLRQELPGAGVTFFLRQSEGCEIYAYRGDEALYRLPEGPEDGFDPDLVDHLCKTNRLCFLDDLLSLGLDERADMLNRYSLVTLPLVDLGRSLGFLLLYRRLPEILTAEELGRIAPVMCGLAQAVRSARVPLPSGE